MVKVDKISIKIGERELSLTPKQAKELRDILDEMYPATTTPPYVPIYIDRWRERWPYRHWDWTWGSGTSDTYTVSDTSGNSSVLLELK